MLMHYSVGLIKIFEFHSKYKRRPPESLSRGLISSNLCSKKDSYFRVENGLKANKKGYEKER